MRELQEDFYLRGFTHSSGFYNRRSWNPARLIGD